MKIKSQRDFLSGLMFIGVGCVFAVGSTNYSMGNSARPGAGYFPIILSVLLVLIGGIVVTRSLLVGDEHDDGRVGAITWRPLLVVVLAIAVFGLTINTLGFALAVPLVIVISSFAGREFRWLGVVISAIALTIFSWLVFVVGLKLTIPVWPGFITS